MILITLNPPYRLEAGDAVYTFRGWCEVDSEEAPDVQLELNGVRVPVITAPRPQVRDHFPGIQVRGIEATVDFRKVLSPEEPFLLRATVRSDARERTFEYGVTPEWAQAVFGRRIETWPVPPEHLQVRVSGAATGEFFSWGRSVLARIEALAGPFGGRVLDFGCGPGRLASLVSEAEYSGCDIDAEAIAWCQQHLGGRGDFRVNPHAPPAPFPDEAFDTIVSISIFTHLPEDMQFAWLADLRRMLRPGGRLLATKLDPLGYDLPPEVRREGVERGFVFWGDSAATEGLPDFYRLAYHTEDYIRREWGQFFDVLRVGSHDINGSQDSVLLRRPL